MITPTYPTFEAAQARVDVLKARGIWPGCIQLPDGTWRLTYDPDISPG